MTSLQILRLAICVTFGTVLLSGCEKNPEAKQLLKEIQAEYEAGNYQQVSLKNMSRAEIIEKSLSNNFQQINDLDYVDQKKINRLCSMCQYKNNCFASQPPYGLLTSVFMLMSLSEIRAPHDGQT